MQPKKSALKKSQPKESASAASAATAPANSASPTANHLNVVMEEEVGHFLLEYNAYPMIIEHLSYVIEDCVASAFHELLCLPAIKCSASFSKVSLGAIRPSNCSEVCHTWTYLSLGLLYSSIRCCSL